MQGLVNFSTAIADAIAVLLPAACYLAACVCFFFAVWTMWSLASGEVQHRHRPWVPFVSLILAGVFASFPGFLTMANVSAGTGLAVSLTSYAPSTPGSATGVLGATPQQSVVNVVALFQYFFQAFGAACVFFAVLRWRSIVNGRLQASALACGVQFLFGVLCINVVTVAAGVVALFT